MIYFLDKDFIDSSNARVDIMSPTVQYGLNVFEGIRGYYCSSGKFLNLVQLEAHIIRLLESAKFLNLNHSYNYDSIYTTILKTVDLNKINYDIYLRVVLLYSEPGSWITSENAILLIAPMVTSSFNQKKPAVSTKISSWERISGRSMPPRIKAGANYLNSRLAQLEVKNSGYDMAIFLNQAGYISEAPGSCVFIVKNGVFYTPSLSSSILGSITRYVVIKIVKEILKQDVFECNLERIDFYQADEAFLCGTAIEITSVKSIDHIVLPEDHFTRIVMENYERFILGSLELSNCINSKVPVL